MIIICMTRGSGPVYARTFKAVSSIITPLVLTFEQSYKYQSVKTWLIFGKNELGAFFKSLRLPLSMHTLPWPKPSFKGL